MYDFGFSKRLTPIHQMLKLATVKYHSMRIITMTSTLQDERIHEFNVAEVTVITLAIISFFWNFNHY